MSNVTSEGCLFNYLFADKYQCPELKKKSCEMIKLNFSVVMETEDFLKLDVDQVMEWVSSDDVIVRAEEEIFRGIVNWVAYSKVEREKYSPDLLHQIRVSSMSHSFLLNELVEEELIKTNHVFSNFVVDSLREIFNTDQEKIGEHPRKCLDTQSDVIFVCGGRKCSCYLPDQDLWSQLPDMIFDSKNQPCVQFRDKIYTFNNQNSKTGQAKVAQYYWSSSNAWVAIQTRLPAEGEEFSSLTTLNGKIYGTGRFSGILFEYNPSKNEWAVKTPAMGRWGCCGVSDGKHIYVVGGTLHEPREHTIGSFKVERFDPNLNKWEEAAAMNEARHNAFGAAMNGKIYIAGGIAANLSEMYSPSTDEWQLMAAPKVPRDYASMVSLSGSLYILGGFRDEITELRERCVEMFDFEMMEWKIKSAIPIDSTSATKRETGYAFKACFARVDRNEL